MKRTFFEILVALCLSFAAGCSPSGLSAENADFGMAKLHFLDVGQGLSVLFQSEESAFLYDAGNDSVGFWDSLKARGVRHLDWALASHWHRDHAGGFLEWDGSVRVDTFFYGPDTGGAWLRDSVLRLAEKYGTVAKKVVRGKRPECGRRDCQILWPADFGTVGGNDASVVLQVSDGASGALLTGDLERAGEEGLLEMSGDLSADILQVGHHGSKNSSSLAFLERTAPKLAVISVGKENGYGHPAKSTLQKLSLVLGDSSRIFRTDRDGSTVVEWKRGAGLWVRNF